MARSRAFGGTALPHIGWVGSILEVVADRKHLDI
jgi:hypothetical protein